MAATQAKPAPAAAPSRPRRRCWRCPTIRRPNSATQLRLGRGAVAMVVATGRRLQVAACASASVHQARRPSRRDFRLRIVLPRRPGPICGLPGRPACVVGRGLRWSSLVVGVWAETRQILWVRGGSRRRWIHVFFPPTVRLKFTSIRKFFAGCLTADTDPRSTIPDLSGCFVLFG